MGMMTSGAVCSLPLRHRLTRRRIEGRGVGVAMATRSLRLFTGWSSGAICDEGIAFRSDEYKQAAIGYY